MVRMNYSRPVCALRTTCCKSPRASHSDFSAHSGEQYRCSLSESHQACGPRPASHGRESHWIHENVVSQGIHRPNRPVSLSCLVRLNMSFSTVRPIPDIASFYLLRHGISFFELPHPQGVGIPYTLNVCRKGGFKHPIQRTYSPLNVS